MSTLHDDIRQSRRDFLTSSASGVGLLALASMLRQDGLLADDDGPALTRAPHFAPKATACICIYLEGAPSQMDLFDPKPKLRELHGQALPESFTKGVRFAFLQKETARILGSNRKFTQHGQCGMELSDYLPHLSKCVDDMALIRSMHTEQFNHHPGQLLMNCGVPTFGKPSMGAWLNYGLGSESKDLPGYVVLNAGRGTSGGASNWSSGFLPTQFQGVTFRGKGEPVLNLSNPPGLGDDLQRETVDAIRDLNHLKHAQVGDPEINTRVAAYELAFRMQSAAPELIDIKGETKETLDLYGVDREDPSKGGRGGVGAGGGTGVYRQFATNCLLARRLVERGVRFVSLYHASWDHHNDLDQELGFNCGMADQPIAALLTDLKRRGLLDTTLVIWASEFGRTPLGENRPGFKEVNGRDHHPFAYSLWMAGGGVQGGQVIGKTDDLGWNVIDEPVHANDFHATILRLFGLDHTRLTYRFQGRDFRLTDVAGKVVERIIA